MIRASKLVIFTILSVIFAIELVVRFLPVEKHLAKGGSFNLDDLTTTKSRFYLQISEKLS